MGIVKNILNSLIIKSDQAEGNITRFEERYHHILDSLLEGCQIIGFDWRYIYMNEAAALLGHRTADEMIGKTMMDAYPGIETTPLFRSLKECMKTRKAKRFENKFTHSDGSSGWYELSVQPAEEGLFILSSEITKRKQAEEMVINTERRGRLLIENAPDGVVLIDVNGRFLYASPSIERLFGYTIKDIPLCLADELTFPEDLPIVLEEMAHLIQDPSYMPTIQYRFLHKNGEWRWIESTFSNLLAVPYVEGIIINFHDIHERKHAEITLRESEKKYHLLFERVNNGYSLNEIITDEKGDPVDYRILEVNIAFENILGKNRVDLINKKGTDLKTLFSGNWKKHLQFYGEAAIKGTEHDFEIFMDSSGRTYNVHIYSPTRNIFAAIFEDITERKNAEGALKKVEDKYFALFNSKTYITFLIEISDRGIPGRIIEANDEAVKIIGYSWEELIKISLSDISVYPLGRAEEVARQFLVGNTARIEQDIKCRDGREFPAEILFYKIFSGDKTYAIIAAKDITEIKRAEKEAEESKRLMDAVMNNVPIGITIVDSGLNIIWCSQAGEMIPGFNVMDNGKKSVLMNSVYYSDTKELVPYDNLPLAKAVNSDMLVENMEVTVYNNGGNLVNLSCNASPVRNNSGEIIGGIMTFQDISTIKKRGEEISNLNKLLVRRTKELERSNMELEAFSYSVSHDLRSPLRHISGYSALIAAKYLEKLGPEGVKYIQQIDDAAKLMGLLIDDLLKLSGVTRAELNIQRINLTDIFESISAETRKAYPDRKIEIINGDKKMANCDDSMMKICLNNLFENAWKFTSKIENPVIEFGKYTDKGKSVFFIRDNGVGFDMKYADKLFKEFQRLHKPLEFEGIGIGLAIVQRVIHKHGGRIWAESEVNKGATFYFVLKD